MKNKRPNQKQVNKQARQNAMSQMYTNIDKGMSQVSADIKHLDSHLHLNNAIYRAICEKLDIDYDKVVDDYLAEAKRLAAENKAKLEKKQAEADKKLAEKEAK